MLDIQILRMQGLMSDKRYDGKRGPIVQTKTSSRTLTYSLTLAELSEKEPSCVCLLSSVTCNEGKLGRNRALISHPHQKMTVTDLFSVFSSSNIAVHIPPYERMELNTCMLLITQRR